MALTIKQFAPIQQRNEWSVQQKAALHKVLNLFEGAVQPQAKPTAFTINTGGTAGTTLAAMTVTEPADLAAVAAQLVIIQASIKSLATQHNALQAALVTAGVLV